MNKIMLNVVGDDVWSKYDTIKQNALSGVIAEYGVVHVTVETCGRAKQVCKSWYEALNACAPCIKLACFQPLFTRTFKVFVTLVSQIDMTQALKRKAHYEKHWSIVSDCPQEEYEKRMFSLTLFWAMSGYQEPSIVLFSFLKNSWDKHFVVAASETLYTNFYKEDPMPKCLETYQGKIPSMPIVEDEFFSMPIGVFLEKIEELEKNSPLHTVYKRLVNKVLTHGLLPIQPKNPVLNGKAPWDLQKKIVVYASLMVLCLCLALRFMYDIESYKN